MERTDLIYTFEEWERLAEDYMSLIPPDNEFFDFEYVKKWYYDDLRNVFVFEFGNEWDMQTFIDKVEECPMYMVTFDIGDLYEGIEWDKLRVTVEAKEGGLI